MIKLCFISFSAKIRGILAAAMLFCLIPAASLAAPDTPYVAAAMLGYANAPAAVQSVADLVYAAAVRHETAVTLPKGTSYSDASAAVLLILSDCPQLFYLDNHYSIGYYQNQPDIATHITLNYLLGQKDADYYTGRVLMEAGEIAGHAAGTPSEKLLYIHDTLCARIEYSEDDRYSHTAMGALVKGYAVCDGYSQAMTLCARLCGIPCTMITGTGVTPTGSGAHAWNVVSLNGTFCFIDATWDDGTSTGLPAHYHFCTSYDQIRGTHIPDADMPVYVPSDDRNEYHRLFGITEGAGWQDAVAARLSDFAVYGTPIEIRFTDPKTYRSFPDTLSSLMEKHNRANPGHAFYGAYTFSYSDSELCYCVFPR